MTVPVCDQCACDIEVNNRRFPGYCSTTCREHARSKRDRAAADLARRRADARQHREANRPPTYLT